ncbi:geranylgeranyl pyrophosphate synthase [Enterococcus sp. JM4C]|uniref:polyprenyl synthetase family protein n=1 Tax=Candidatus Enterococcus huntleyi TaxID=1857217 RepID=UPI001379F491|nr:polyprenyl synthetase family protein [Enterococcus sp. JM4C]KAF1297970.1 geranylgeranyl pyrophosphate synthase [Enterococcus sp. JM4C]
MKLHPLWKPYPSISKELATTLNLMEKSINLKNKAVEKAVLEMIHSGGKMLRPAYQLLFSQFGPQQDRQKAMALAASIEMLHTATLLHDDVVDDADLRRGLPTVRSTFGNDVAVYAGDYLLVCCFKLLADYSGSLKSLQLNSRSMEKILSGELGQMESRYQFDGTVTQYIENISGKTAELFALSCSIGAYESGMNQRFAKKCGDIGLNIGIAFQIIDDILDYTQDSQEIGKPVLEDVRQGIYSLPLLYALQEDKQSLLPYLEKREAMTEDDTQQVFALVHQLHGVEKAQELAEIYTKKALTAIDSLPENEQQTKVILATITKNILTRTN